MAMPGEPAAFCSYLGRHPTRLRYIGCASTSFTHAMLTDLARRLHPPRRATSPFATPVPAQHARDVQWVQPRPVGKVAFTE